MDQVTPELMAEMRAQAAECTWREAEDYGETGAEYIDSLSDAEVLAHYERQPGGIEQFAQDSGMDLGAEAA
jgi:hypothetical protein